MGRRDSNEGSPPRPPADRDPDVFDDEHTLDPDEDSSFMPTVSDGFRPASASRGPVDRLPRDDHQRIPPAHPSDVSGLRRAATRNSIAKVPCGQDAPLPNGTPPRGSNSQATPSLHRVSTASAASFATMANSDAPLGSAPSHPYAMYTQHTVARNASISSTPAHQQPPRSASSPVATEPSHPYGLYPQNGVDVDPPVPPVQTAMPLGFPPAGATGFHRQIGPDGEEQDIVGPFGHTEQLPPYSRYPEEGPTKLSMAAEASATSTESRTDPLAASDAHRIDADASALPSPVSPISPVAAVAPARLPPQRPETQTGNVAPRPATTSESASLLTTEEHSVSEKVELEPSIKQEKWHSKRMCGKVPVSVALCLLLLLLVGAIVLGVAIGIVFAKNKDQSRGDRNRYKHEKPESQVTGATLFGASPIPTPTSLPSLPVGQFSLPLGIAQESSPGCLTQGNEYAAWSCKMSFAPLQLVINSTADGYLASLQSWTPPDGTIQYGLQSPSIPPSALQLVSDLDYRGFGPAWHFASTYDKVVVLQADEFLAGKSVSKRHDKQNKKRDKDNDKTSFRHWFQVRPGDTPWYCIWNSTYIEGYIYVTDNSTAATMTNFPTPGPSDPFSPAFMTGIPSATASITQSGSASPVPTLPPMRRDPQRGEDRLNFRLPVPYPRIVKIEERRLPVGPPPYCQKMQLLENGQIAPASGSDGAIVVQLSEQDPRFEEFFGTPSGPSSPNSSSDAAAKRTVPQRRTDPSSACHCQWMFQ